VFDLLVTMELIFWFSNELKADVPVM
jgi:hypothetical protein